MQTSKLEYVDEYKKNVMDEDTCTKARLCHAKVFPQATNYFVTKTIVLFFLSFN